MKKVLITGGPTNEYIDEVMKITNMSSGKIAIELAKYFAADDYHVTLLVTKSVKHPDLVEVSRKNNVLVMCFETTEELMNLIKERASLSEYDIVIHSAAVADYKPEFSFRAEDMAAEIARKVCTLAATNADVDQLYNEIFDTLTNPECRVNDDTKISSVEPNLTVKLGLTPKIIASLRSLFPNAFIAGFKLLENVPEQELVDAAMKQMQKCQTDLVFANDLAELRKGNASRMVVTPAGNHDIKVDGAYGIFNLLKIATE